jgi:hypothetical protein
MNEISIILNLFTIIFFSITLLVIGVCLFLIGYFLGKQGSYGVSNIVGLSKPSGFFDHNKEDKKKKIVIDNAKFVTEIKTDGMEKKYENLGEIKQSTENITDSINKLKNLRKE